MEAEAEHWIRTLSLAAHPEGGWFRETYRSPVRVPGSALPPRFGAERSLASGILYLLAAGERSHFHRLLAADLWWHHRGGAVHLVLLDGSGARRQSVGPARPQGVVPQGTWFAAEPAPGASFALAGCGVSPGFEFADFELAERARLLAAYPGEEALVLRFTKGNESS